MDKIEYTKSKYHVRYPESLKEQVCREFLTGQYTKEELSKKYDIRGKARLLTWLREYRYRVPDEKSLTMPETEKPDKKSFTPEQKKIRELEKALQDAELRAEAYWRMIRIAEEDFNVPILKKSHTKPSEL